MWILKSFDDGVNTQNYWVFGLIPSSGILENSTTFRKLDLCPSPGEGGTTPTYWTSD
jgi:hypothetical protein